MKDIVHHKFSLFQLEKYLFFDDVDTLSENTFILLGIFDHLEDAKAAQEKLKVKSIILPSY